MSRVVLKDMSVGSLCELRLALSELEEHFKQMDPEFDIDKFRFSLRFDDKASERIEVTVGIVRQSEARVVPIKLVLS